MCYRHATTSFDRPCPECGSLQCNQSMYCGECGAEMPYVAHPEHLKEASDLYTENSGSASAEEPQ